MPNGRFVSKSISANEQLAGVSLLADYLFQRCIPHLDVEGRITGNPQLLKAAVVPLRVELSADTIPDLLRELGAAVDAAGRSLVIWYEVGTQKVLWFPGFREHQQGMKKEREAASRLPPLESATAVIIGQDLVRSRSGSGPDQVPQKLSQVEVEERVEVQDQVKGEAVDLDQSGAERAADAPAAASVSATASPAAQEERRNGHGFPLPEYARRILRDCYEIRGRVIVAALTDRQKQVYQDFLATLGERGALLERNTYVRAVDAAHLDEACHRVLTGGVRQPDAAIRLVLLDLRKTWQETKAAREKAAIGESTKRERDANTPPQQPTRVGLLAFKPKLVGVAEAQRWFEALPLEERGPIGERLERAVAEKCGERNAPSWRAEMRSQLLVEIWKQETGQVTPSGNEVGAA